jgi:hypothetical protein
MIAKIDSLGAGLSPWYRQGEGHKGSSAMITKKILVPDRVRTGEASNEYLRV